MVVPVDSSSGSVSLAPIWKAGAARGEFTHYVEAS